MVQVKKEVKEEEEGGTKKIKKTKEQIEEARRMKLKVKEEEEQNRWRWSVEHTHSRSCESFSCGPLRGPRTQNPAAVFLWGPLSESGAKGSRRCAADKKSFPNYLATQFKHSLL